MNTKAKTFSLVTLGCKVNQYEGQQVRQLLESLGLVRVGFDCAADVAVVNTCCVTHTASAKCRQHINKARKLNNKAEIVVCGCLPRVETGELKTGEKLHLVGADDSLAEVVEGIVGKKRGASGGHEAGLGRCKVRSDKELQSGDEANRAVTATGEGQEQVAQADGAEQGADAVGGGCAGEGAAASDDARGRTEARKSGLGNGLRLGLLRSFSGHTRAFLKVQDGCDGYCTYCIVPKTRARLSSKPVAEVVGEAEALATAGHKEIVVSGVFLGAYGLDTVRRRRWETEHNDGLAELLEVLAKVKGLERVRLSSLEPGDVTERLVETLANNRNIMPHLHLSLQSGSDAVLRRMVRQYRSGEFLEKVRMLKERLDRPAITTDVIVGFPGETDADFERTVEVAREVGFARMHVFPFSARRGTSAAKLQNTVNTEVIKKRAKILRGLAKELAGEFRSGFIGETAEVLVEQCGRGSSGRSERYFKVYLDQRVEKNEIVRVRLVKNRQDGVDGKVLQRGYPV